WLQQLARCIDCSGYLRAIATGNYRAQGGQPAKTLSGKAESKFFRLESVHQAVVRDVNSHDSLTPSDIGYDQWQGFELRAHWCYPTCNSLLNPGWKYKERKRKWQAKNSAGLLACHKIMRKPSSFNQRRFRRAGL